MANIKISTTNKRSVGRPSLRCISVRRAPKHHAVNFSQTTVKDLYLQEGCKVELLTANGNYYLCVNTENGYNVKVKKNGGHKNKAVDTLTCSSAEIVNTLLSLANAEKVAKFIIAAKATTINGKKSYLIISTPLRVD